MFHDCNRISSNSLFTLTRRPDVTDLRRDLAHKASAQSITELQAQVDVVQDAVRQKASVLNFSRLEGVVCGKASVGDVASKANETALESVRAQLVAAKAEGRRVVHASVCGLASNAKQDAGHEALPGSLPRQSRGGDSLGGCLGVALGFLQLGRYSRR